MSGLFEVYLTGTLPCTVSCNSRIDPFRAWKGLVTRALRDWGRACGQAPGRHRVPGSPVQRTGCWGWGTVGLSQANACGARLKEEKAGGGPALSVCPWECACLKWAGVVHPRPERDSATVLAAPGSR